MNFPSIPLTVTRHCLMCLRHIVPGECVHGIEACPDQCDRVHIGVDIGSRDATAVAIISPIEKPAGRVFTAREVITTVHGAMVSLLLNPNCFSQPTNSSECSHTENPERECDCFGGFCQAGNPCLMENKG